MTWPTTIGRLIAAVLMITAGTAGVSTGATSSVSDVALKNCHLTIHFLKESDGQRMYRQGWLPKGQPLSMYSPYGPGSASLTIWVFACDRTELDGKSTGAAILSLSGIQIQDRLHAVSPTHWDNYMVWAQTNNVALSRAFRAARLPVSTVPRMQFKWRANPHATSAVDGDLTTVTVPWGQSPHSLEVRGKVYDEPHVHDNTFQYGSRPGVGPRLELLIDPLLPRDRFCAQVVQTDCMKVVAKSGSKMARFVGSAEYSLAADHELITQVKLRVVGR